MRPSDGGFDIWPFAVIGFILVLVVASVTPVVRLNPQPPASFVRLGVHAGKPDEALARQYWDTSVKIIQWKYRRTDSLPTTPPAEFQPTSQEGTFRAQNASVRRAYWRSFRGEWLKRENWHKTYSVDIAGIWNNLVSVWNGAVNFFQSRG